MNDIHTKSVSILARIRTERLGDEHLAVISLQFDEHLLDERA